MRSSVEAKVAESELFTRNYFFKNCILNQIIYKSTPPISSLSFNIKLADDSGFTQAVQKKHLPIYSLCVHCDILSLRVMDVHTLTHTLRPVVLCNRSECLWKKVQPFVIWVMWDVDSFWATVCALGKKKKNPTQWTKTVHYVWQLTEVLCQSTINNTYVYVGL